MSAKEQRQVIATYGLGESELEMVRKCGLDVEVVDYDSWTDLVMIWSDLAIVNPYAGSWGDMERLAQMYREAESSESRVIITKGHEAFRRISFVEAREDLFEDQRALSLIIVDRLKGTKRDIDFSRRIAIAMRILHLICTKPGITTKELAAELEVSERGVRRYVRSLQAATFAIGYENRGWRCCMNPRETAWVTKKWILED